MIEQHFVNEVEVSKKIQVSTIFSVFVFSFTPQILGFSPTPISLCSIEVQMWLSNMYQFITPAFTSQLTLCLIKSINASDISISHVTSVSRLPSCSLLNAVWR